MTASVSVDSGRRAWRASASSDLDTAFRRARQHSRVVKTLRFLIPGGVVGSLALYFIAGWLNPFGGLAALPSMSKFSISGSRVTMDAPRLSGYTRDGRAYELTAAAAAQDLKRPQFIELQEIRARVELQSGETVKLTAEAGVYDSKAETVKLQQNVRVNISDGSEIRLQEAHVDVRKGTVVSQHPVEVSTPQGDVTAQSVEVAESGGLIRFRGNVKMNLKPEAATPGPVGQAGSSR